MDPDYENIVAPEPPSSEGSDTEAFLDENEIQSPNTPIPIPGGNEALLLPSDKKGSVSDPSEGGGSGATIFS